jgi:DNA repair protein RadA/Sms
MSKKAQTVYVCTACGASSPRWLGRCPQCQGWGTLAEERARGSASGSGRKAAGAARPGGDTARAPTKLSDVSAEDARRLTTGLAELDRVLGGGVVGGSVVLVGGDPGIGKSTLLMQALAGLAARGGKTLYVTGEESASQIALRARRLDSPGVDDVIVLATTDLEDVEAALAKGHADVAVIDSIQTIRSGDLESAAGSVGQLREVTARLVDVAKRTGVALFLIGHVTKDGAIAGPKLLEHLVDVVLSFEGDRTHAFRLVRTTKNRFGPSQEVAVFEMVREGLREVPDPSALFLAERPRAAAGSLVVATAEGSRPLLVEVQALVAPAVYGAARRVATGLDGNRLAILLAVLERKADVHVLDRDVFASVAGGARVEEPALDLALAIAVVSSLRERAVAPGLVVFGEVGLAGEVRAVPRAAPRLAESRKMGFGRAIIPRGNAQRLTAEEREGLEIVEVVSLTDALRAALDP